MPEAGVQLRAWAKVRAWAGQHRRRAGRGSSVPQRGAGRGSSERSRSEFRGVPPYPARECPGSPDAASEHAAKAPPPSASSQAGQPASSQAAPSDSAAPEARSAAMAASEHAAKAPPPSLPASFLAGPVGAQPSPPEPPSQPGGVPGMLPVSVSPERFSPTSPADDQQPGEQPLLDTPGSPSGEAAPSPQDADGPAAGVQPGSSQETRAALELVREECVAMLRRERAEWEAERRQFDGDRECPP